jgi:prophage DNA circulation protein
MPQPQTPFQASLLPASFRGVPFGVIDSHVAAGRRGETHEYPFRDTPFREDLGRRARRIAFTAFLLGDDVAAQASALLSAVEQKGSGMLVHPSFGAFLMSVDERAELAEHWDKGRYIEVRLSFVEPGQDMFPLGSADTQAAVQSSALNAAVASGTDFNNTVNNVAASRYTADGTLLAGSAVDNDNTLNLPTPSAAALGDGP